MSRKSKSKYLIISKGFSYVLEAATKKIARKKVAYLKALKYKNPMVYERIELR